MISLIVLKTKAKQMKTVKILLLPLMLLLIVGITSCDKNGDLVLFSINNDIELGQQVAAEIENMPNEFPILDRSQYPEAYDYMDNMLDEILQSGDVTYRTEFPWEVYIINDDETLNAFATPGGQLYFYTGLIYFLDREDDLAGVMGHEIAHSDQRHSSKQLQRDVGISALLSIITGGDASKLTQIAGQLAGTLGGLAFSRSAEAEADDFSVEYLAGTKYSCNGAAAFFEKLDNDDNRAPEFLSTHPRPDNRVGNINSKADEENCNTSPSDADRSSLAELQALLP